MPSPTSVTDLNLRPLRQRNRRVEYDHASSDLAMQSHNVPSRALPLYVISSTLPISRRRGRAGSSSVLPRSPFAYTGVNERRRRARYVCGVRRDRIRRRYGRTRDEGRTARSTDPASRLVRTA